MLAFHIQEDLKWNSLYVACIQFGLLYGCKVFHFSLPPYLSLTFEVTQKSALRIIIKMIIFGYEVHYSDALSRSGLVTLEQRRTELCNKLFTKIVENPLIYLLQSMD